MARCSEQPPTAALSTKRAVHMPQRSFSGLLVALAEAGSPSKGSYGTDFSSSSPPPPTKRLPVTVLSPTCVVNLSQRLFSGLVFAAESEIVVSATGPAAEKKHCLGYGSLRGALRAMWTALARDLSHNTAQAPNVVDGDGQV